MSSDVEILDARLVGEADHYIRYAAWRDETRKASGRGTHIFTRPDGGQIVADLLNDHLVRVPSSGRELVLRDAPTGPMVFHLSTGQWVDLLSYRGALANLQYRTWTIDATAEFLLPAIARFRARLQRPHARWGDRTGTTLNLIVVSGNDDGYQRHDLGTNTTATSTVDCYNSMTSASSRRTGGARFTGVAVPQGATINAADVIGYVVTTSADDPYGAVHFEAADNSATLSGGTALRSRPFTAANLPVNATAVGAGDYTMDVTAAVQEVVNRGGWASGNALCMIFETGSAVTRLCGFRDYGSSTTQCFRLDVDYSVGAAPAVCRTVMLCGGLESLRGGI